jgi:hypothetical protein
VRELTAVVDADSGITFGRWWSLSAWKMDDHPAIRGVDLFGHLLDIVPGVIPDIAGQTSEIFDDLTRGGERR